MPVSRRQIVRACKGRGWQIQPTALKGIEAYLQDYDDVDADFLDQLGDYIDNAASKRTLTKDIWEKFVQEDQQPSGGILATTTTTHVSGNKSHNPSSRANPWSDLQVVSAFQDVKLVYHTMKKHFRTEEQPWSLFGTAEDKVWGLFCCDPSLGGSCFCWFRAHTQHHFWCCFLSFDDRFKCTCNVMP